MGKHPSYHFTYLFFHLEKVSKTCFELDQQVNGFLFDNIRIDKQMG